MYHYHKQCSTLNLPLRSREMFHFTLHMSSHLILTHQTSDCHFAELRPPTGTKYPQNHQLYLNSPVKTIQRAKQHFLPRLHLFMPSTENSWESSPSLRTIYGPQGQSTILLSAPLHLKELTLVFERTLNFSFHFVDLQQCLHEKFQIFLFT